ncbi:MAG: hypothetical protein IPL37_11535 [Austwickia sp.]|nr:hypothetical protein [Austwickia sp.]
MSPDATPTARERVLYLLRERGPLTGAELVEATRIEPLPLWRICRRSEDIIGEQAGRQYLRLDRAVQGYARLSPSIRREFLTYTAVGVVGQETAVCSRAEEITAQAERISRTKSNTAREAMASVIAEVGLQRRGMDEVTFIIAGDVTYGMAHSVPRPESSTGQLVIGSDLDIIVVATDDFPQDLLMQLDQAIYRRKYYLLRHPGHREEIDYIIKRLAKVADQVAFDTFEHGVAAKILHEGQLLCGSFEVFDEVKRLVAEAGVPQRVDELEAAAIADRADAQDHLLQIDDDVRTGEHFNLFYTREEGEEIY